MIDGAKDEADGIDLIGRDGEGRVAEVTGGRPRPTLVALVRISVLRFGVCADERERLEVFAAGHGAGERRSDACRELLHVAGRVVGSRVVGGGRARVHDSLRIGMSLGELGEDSDFEHAHELVGFGDDVGPRSLEGLLVDDRLVVLPELADTVEGDEVGDRREGGAGEVIGLSVEWD